MNATKIAAVPIQIDSISRERLGVRETQQIQGKKLSTHVNGRPLLRSLYAEGRTGMFHPKPLQTLQSPHPSGFLVSLSSMELFWSAQYDIELICESEIKAGRAFFQYSEDLH